MTNSRSSINVNGRQIGADSPVYVIAEIGMNHGGDMGLGCEMIAAAAQAGAAAVKFQTFQADHLAVTSAPHFQLIKDAEIDFKGHETLAATAQANGVDFISTPFCQKSLDLLIEIGVPAIKVASMDVTHTPLLQAIGGKKVPVFLSTGMATLEEIGGALDCLSSSGATEIAVLHCVSHYPAAAEKLDLRTIAQLASAYQRPVGFSDHSLSSAAAIAAVALGATVIEKHFTLDKTLPGPDHQISADPEQLDALVQALAEVQAGLGRNAADDQRSDRENAALFRRSVHAAVNIPAGTVIELEMLKYVRPGDGISPSQRDTVLGRRASRDLEAETKLTNADIQ